MEAREKTFKTLNGSEGVLTIPKDENPKDLKGSFPESTTRSDFISGRTAKQVPMGCPSPEMSRFCSSPNKPPRSPTTPDAAQSRRRSLVRSVYSKPKSRFGEQPFSGIESGALGEHEEQLVCASSDRRHSFSRTLSKNKSFSSMRTNSIAAKTTSMGSHGGPREDEEEELYKEVLLRKENHKGIQTIVLIEWLIFVCIVGSLVASLTVEKLVKYMVWGLEIWKWCVLVLVIFSGMLLTNWAMHIIVFLIERNFLLRKKVLYFVHGLKKSVQVFVWLGLVLLTWVLLFNGEEKRSKVATTVLHCITWTLASCLIGAFLWLLKTLLLKILASKFHVNTFFDRIQESIFHQYVLQTLSGPPLVEEAERVGISLSSGQLSFRSTKNGKESKEKKVIDIGKVHSMKQEKVSAGAIGVLVDAIMNSRLSTISNTLDESVNGRSKQMDKEITNEMEAKTAAYSIFRNVAKHGCKFIEEEDLLRFMIKEEVDLFFPLIEGSDTGRIYRKSLINWVVKVYQDRRALGHTLNDTKTAVEQLNKLVTVVLFIATIIVWLLLMEIATTKLLVVLSSQILVAGFIFKNACKALFEAIIFVFVMHPFDVGDRCCVDGVPLLVEEMNLLTTVFLKLDNEKVYYPNSILAMKPISNYYRSPDMGDLIEFAIDFMTPMERIGMLKDKIKMYLENNPQHWHANHLVMVKEIENVNKIKIALICNHTINFQEWREKNKRRSELVIELKRIFEELNIKYNLLPQQVHIGYIAAESAMGHSR